MRKWAKTNTHHTIPEKESTPNVSEGTFEVKSFEVVPSVKFGEMGKLTFKDGTKAHTFSSVLIKQFKELVEAKKLPAKVTITRVKRYLTLA